MKCSNDSTVARARSPAVLGVAGFDEHVLGGLVDRLLVGAPDLDDSLAQLRVGRERRDGRVEQLLRRGSDFVLGWLRACPSLRAVGQGRGPRRCPCEMSWRSSPPASCSSSLAIVLASAAGRGGRAGRRSTRRRRGRGLPNDDLLEELLERHRRLALQRLGVVEVGLGDADGVDDDEVVLAAASGVTAWRSVALMTRTPRPFICSKKFRLLTARMNMTTRAA